MANTTNFGWETPDDTDLVKDGALAMRTLGNAIDTSLVDLKGGTTNQILAKNSNTDMDFKWVANDVGDITAVTAGTGLSGGGTSGDVTLTNTVATAFDAAGDLIYGTGADTFTKLALGTAGQVLKVNSGATAPEWGAAGGASFVGCGLYKDASTQSLSNDTATAITFDAEEFDTDGFHSTSSNTSRITIPTGKGGKYLFIGVCQFASNGTGNRAIDFRVNGTLVQRGVRLMPVTDATDVTNMQASAILNLVATDYVECFAFQKSGGNLNISNGQTVTKFFAYYLGA